MYLQLVFAMAEETRRPSVGPEATVFVSFQPAISYILIIIDLTGDAQTKHFEEKNMIYMGICGVIHVW